MNCECHICGYKWVSRKDSPKQCPRCKRMDWQKVGVAVYRYMLNDTFACAKVRMLESRDER